MKTTILIFLVIVVSLGCSLAPSNSTSNSTQTQNIPSSGASGEAGRAPSPTPSPSATSTPSNEGATKTVTVRFPTGATEASYTDSFSGYGYIDYVFDAKANQNLTAEITKADANKAILTVMRSGNPVEVDASQVQGWTGILPENGRYTVRVGQMRDDARKGEAPVKFSIMIRIVN
jgi:hypothetical protein